MGVKSLMRGVGAAGAMLAAAVGSAHAQSAACEETQFSAKAGEVYLAAETELVANENPAGALEKLQQLKALELNCYEFAAALRLGAAIKIQNQDYRGAVADLQQALDQGIIPEAERASTLYNIFQIYLSIEELEKAVDTAQKWMAAGGEPSRDNKWTLAVVQYKLDNDAEALKWAEQVFAADGPNAARQVYDFLILLYDRTGNLAKKAQLLEQLLVRNPEDRQLWDAISGDYFRADDERKAFEVQKAMYLGGILQDEDELLRIVNFYNRFNAPYEAARVLEKEINAGRISETYENLELLANLYQVSREYRKAIPVIERAAQLKNAGRMYERLGRSYIELQEWDKGEEALLKAINAGDLKDRGGAWVLIGQARYENDDREGAREAFRNANNRGGRGWLDFMNAEEQTAKAFRVFEAQTVVTETQNEKKACDRLRVLGDQLPEGCATVEERLQEAQERVDELQSA